MQKNSNSDHNSHYGKITHVHIKAEQHKIPESSLLQKVLAIDFNFSLFNFRNIFLIRSL